jgi:hypothetical protein
MHVLTVDQKIWSGILSSVVKSRASWKDIPQPLLVYYVHYTHHRARPTYTETDGIISNFCAVSH